MSTNTGITVPPLGGGSGGGGGSGTPPSLLVGNMVLVSKQGNDGIAARQDWKYHYLSYDAAFAVAQTGDTIIVMPGDYLLTTLLKNGVSLYCYPGVTLRISTAISIGSLSSSNIMGHADIIDEAGGISFELAAGQSMVMQCNSITATSLNITGASTDAQFTIDIENDIYITGTAGCYINNPTILSLNMKLRDFIQEAGETSTGLQIWGNHATGNEIVIKGRNCINRDQGFVCIRYGDVESDNFTNCLIEFDLFESQADWLTLSNVIVGAVDVVQETAGDDYQTKYRTVFGHSNTVYSCVGSSSAIIVACCQWVYVNGHISTYNDSVCIYYTNESATRTLLESIQAYNYFNCSFNQNDVSSNTAIICQGANTVYFNIPMGIYRRRLVEFSGGNISPYLTGQTQRHQVGASTTIPISITGDNEIVFFDNFNNDSGGAANNIYGSGDGIVVHAKNVKLTGSTSNCIDTSGTVDVVLLSLYTNVGFAAMVTNIVAATTIIVDTDISN